MTTYRTLSTSKKWACGLLGLAGVGGGVVALSLEQTVAAVAMDADCYAHPAHFHWPHDGFLDSYDAKSIRRGYEVYKNVCATCHGCFTVAYRMLRNVCATPAEVKAEAKKQMFIDGPNDKGEMFERAGKTSDYLPKPYLNDMAAAYANGGKTPPDLGLITFARTGYENYIFSLMTGYQDPPAGFKLEEDLHFNPYFRGGAISMPPPLYNGVIEYTDGTPASMSQCAKDVACFLRFAAEPWHDDRKQIGMKAMMLMSIICMSVLYFNRHIQSTYRRVQVFYIPHKTKAKKP